MKDYSQGKIYKLQGNGLTYYGSTCEPTLARRRKTKHKSNYKRYLNGTYHYVTSFKCFEKNSCNPTIILVENYPCNNSDELLFARERYYIENKECVNKTIPNRTDAEYYQCNKEKIKALNSQYKKDHEEYYKNYMKTYTQIKIKCECGSTISEAKRCAHFKTKKHQDYLLTLE